MKEIVILAATEREIAACREKFRAMFCVTGIGGSNTAIATMQAAQKYNPSLMIQVGIAGAYGRELEIGDAVLVASDRQADLGAWRAGESGVSEIGEGISCGRENLSVIAGKFEEFSHEAPVIECPWAQRDESNEPVVITNSEGHRTTPSVAAFNERNMKDLPFLVWKGRIARAQSVNCAASPLVFRGSADIETMEGAAFFSAAKASGVRFLQLRTISNYIDDPRSEWRIDEAISAIPDALRMLLPLDYIK